MAASDLVIVSNRGPLSFATEDGELVTTRAAGGLVASLAPAVAGSGVTWVAAAIGEADRAAAATGVVEAEGFRVRSLVIDDVAYRQFYDVIANTTLWYLHHDLWDGPLRPRFDRTWHEAWDTFRAVNEAFADAVAEEAPADATVLVHDYHLSLTPARLAKERPDLAVVYFHHTPFCDPSTLRVLPSDAAHELVESLAAARACGFHARRWADAFERCAEELGVEVRTFVSPAVPDVADLRAVAASPACEEAFVALDRAVGDRKLIVRVDRIELSKNILRGFLAYEDLLETRPQWRGRVVFGAFVYPSRQALPDYQAYRRQVEALVDRVNARFGDASWTPILLDPVDAFPRSVAALRRYDVLLVNPVRDGLNLVAKEGPLVNERHGVLALSPEAGAWDELGHAAVEVHPFDVAVASDALHRALSLDDDERRAHAVELRRVAEARTQHDWLADQLAAARR